jgi:hypothetical protein
MSKRSQSTQTPPNLRRQRQAGEAGQPWAASPGGLEALSEGVCLCRTCNGHQSRPSLGFSDMPRFSASHLGPPPRLSLSKLYHSHVTSLSLHPFTSVIPVPESSARVPPPQRSPPGCLASCWAFWSLLGPRLFQKRTSLYLCAHWWHRLPAVPPTLASAWHTEGVPEIFVSTHHSIFHLQEELARDRCQPTRDTAPSTTLGTEVAESGIGQSRGLRFAWSGMEASVLPKLILVHSQG